MKIKNWRIFYPLLLGIYPVVGLVAVNISQMSLSVGLRSVLVTVVFTLMGYAFFCWRIKDEYKAALLFSVFVVFFYAYGHFYDFIEGIKIFGFTVGRHRYLFPIWLLGFAGLGWWIYKRPWKLESFSRILNMTSIVLLVIPIVQIGSFEWQRYRSVYGLGNTVDVPTSQEGGITSNNMDQLPDVYYIILDGYPRQDALLQYHDFDNSDFIAQLEALGFYVPACSQSNYAMTQLSLASSLNLNYIDQLGSVPPDINLNDKIVNSEVRDYLESLGYKTVSFESGIWFTEFREADYFISQDRPVVDAFFDFTRISEFEVVYVRTTILRLAEEAKTAWLDSLFVDYRKQLYERILFEFDQLELVSSIPGPKFVFVHILAPHTTEAIINANGDYELSTSIDPALGNEILYLNARTLEAVQSIIANSKNPPIIIIQGDHGIDTEMRLANLSAYYFPNNGSRVLYPTLTSVNSFRLVFNTYFGQDFPLLPDLSYYSPYNDMFSFTQVQYPCSQEK